MKKVNEVFYFEKDTDLDSEVSNQAKDYKLYSFLVKVYKEHVNELKEFDEKGKIHKTFRKVLGYIFDESVKVGSSFSSYYSKRLDVWIEFMGEEWSSNIWSFYNIKNFYDLAKQFSQNFYRESSNIFINRFFEHINSKYKNILNEAFDFENDNIDIESEVKKISKKYKLYEILVRAYEDEISESKFGGQGVKSDARNLRRTLDYVFDTSIETDYEVSLDNTVYIWIQISESPYTSASFEFDDVKDFYDLAKRFSMKVYEESNPDFKKRFLSHIRNEFRIALNEAFDFEVEEEDYDKDVKANLNRLKLYRKFKRLLHAEVDAIGNDIVNYDALTDLFSTLMSEYGLYIGYSIANLTIGPECNVKYWNYGGLTPRKESFKLDIGIIELGDDYVNKILQNLKDGLDKIVNLNDKRKNEVYDDYLDRCISNIWVTKFFRDKEKVNRLPYKFVDYINESLDFSDEDYNDLDNSVKSIADIHRRKERLFNELYQTSLKVSPKYDYNASKIDETVFQYTDGALEMYYEEDDAKHTTFDSDTGHWVEFDCSKELSFEEVLKNLVEAIYDNMDDKIVEIFESNW